MTKDELQEFASILVTAVRDAAIKSCDISLDKGAKGPVAERWRARLRKGKPAELASEMIPDCIDEAIFYLLNSIDEGSFKLSFTTSTGKVINLPKAGGSELAGWYMATGGWRQQFSEERINDDFADLV